MVTATGKQLKAGVVQLGGAGTVTLKLKLTGAGIKALKKARATSSRSR